MDESINNLIEFSRDKAYKAVDILSMEMRNRRYEIRMNQSGKKLFLSINNRSKLLYSLYHCMIHQEPVTKISTVNVYSGNIETIELSVKQINSIINILDKKNDDIDILVSNLYKKIREYDSLPKLRIVLKEIMETRDEELKRYYGSMK